MAPERESGRRVAKTAPDHRWPSRFWKRIRRKKTVLQAPLALACRAFLPNEAAISIMANWYEPSDGND